MKKLLLALTLVFVLAGGRSPAADFNGDGKDDVAIFRPASGLWSVRGITRAYFGTKIDIPLPGDYVGGAAAEMAIGGGLGVRLQTDVDLFDESPSRFLLEVEGAIDIGTVVGEVLAEKTIDLGACSLTLDEAREAFFHWERLL